MRKYEIGLEKIGRWRCWGVVRGCVVIYHVSSYVQRWFQKGVPPVATFVRLFSPPASTRQ